MADADTHPFRIIEEFGTHKVLHEGLVALDCMEHRGACGGDGVSGDGAGIMTQIPWKTTGFKSQAATRL